jgi:hypothetical protein
MVETITFAKNPKKRKHKCAPVPHRAPMISKNVWAFGAFIFKLEARMANNRIWTVAPAA